MKNYKPVFFKKIVEFLKSLLLYIKMESNIFTYLEMSRMIEKQNSLETIAVHEYLQVIMDMKMH